MNFDNIDEQKILRITKILINKSLKLIDKIIEKEDLSTVEGIEITINYCTNLTAIVINNNSRIVANNNNVLTVRNDIAKHFVNALLKNLKNNEENLIK